MDISIPKAGHWQRIQYGKQVEIPDLPPENSVTIKSTIDLIPIIEKKVDRVAQLKEDIEVSCKQYLKVNKKLIDPDIVTIEVKKNLEGRTPSHFGKEKGYISTYRHPIRFFVTPKNSSRALRILDTFVKLVRARNHEISLNGWTYEIIIGDDRYEFGIKEKQVREESKERGYAFDYKATGLLVLSTGRFLRKREYIDGKLPLEKQLSSIVANLEYQEELWQEEMEKHRADQAIVQLRFDELCKVFNDQDVMLNTIKTEYSTLMSVLTESTPVEAVKEKATVTEKINELQGKIDPAGLHLEICGTWLWVTGKTYPVKDQLKELVFRYSSNKLS